MLRSFSALLALLQLLNALPSASATSAQDWKSFNTTLGGRLRVGVPYSQPCYTLLDGGRRQTPNPAECGPLQAGNADHLFRSNIFGGYAITQWETCQATEDQCLLDNVNPANPAAFSPPRVCAQGSVPSYYVDVTGPTDVANAFKFVKNTKTTLVIKNTGHDYKGRSVAPGSLALWTHHLNKVTYERSFVPEGCNDPATTAFTLGAGAQFEDIYALSDANNVTFVGGADISVGAAGGWIQGGGHSSMSPALGLGVDRVLQFKIVTPDGQYRTVNKCQNQDLFFALRGGGGGTFGVVLESTSIVTPRVTVQAVLASYSSTPDGIKKAIKAFAVDSVRRASEGWGGYINPADGSALYGNPLIDADAAKQSMASLSAQLQAIGGNLTFFTLPSYPAFFNTFIRTSQDPVGTPFQVVTRLIPASKFNDTQLIDTIADGMTHCSFPQILSVAPFAFKGYDNNTSVTPAWRDSVWHVLMANTWNFNTTKAERVNLLNSLETLINPIRKLTPGSGSYQNEADVYEPDHEKSFWGDNYPALLKIKQKYDPDHLLDCWHCVGWKGKQDSRYKCYLDIKP